MDLCGHVSDSDKCWLKQVSWHLCFIVNYEKKPIRGCRKSPRVPSTHTSTKTQRKMRSITMATYFQSSST